MDWIVRNALSRDTEREQLNKILAEIKKAIDGKSTTTTPAPSTSNSTVTTSRPREITVTLTGDVEGQGKGSTGISIATTLTNPGVEEAPTDGNFYWRLNGTWQPVSPSILALDYLEAGGLMAWNYDEGAYYQRTIEGTLGQIVITDGDGINGNPIVALDEDILALLPEAVPSLANADITDIVPGMAVARIGAGYVRADKATADRWNVVGLYIGDTDVPPTEQLKPKVDGIVTLTALQWDAVLGTSGGLAVGMTYFLGNDGVLTVTPPSVDGEYNVAVGLAITSTELHIRDMRPVKL